MNQVEFGVRWLLKRFQIFPNAYYNYLKCKKTNYNKHKQSIQHKIKEIFHSENGKMGYRMIKLLLEKQGTNVSLLTVHKYMKELNLKSISFRKKPNYVKGTPHKTFKNLLKREFTSPNKNHKPSDKLILHSDQGSQYMSKAFTTFCETNKIQQSMSNAGCPYDNAPMESFYGKLKSEHLNHYNIMNTTHLNELTNDYIFRYYHHKKNHSSLGGLTPFEKRYL